MKHEAHMDNAGHQSDHSEEPRESSSFSAPSTASSDEQRRVEALRRLANSVLSTRAIERQPRPHADPSPSSQVRAIGPAQPLWQRWWVWLSVVVGVVLVASILLAYASRKPSNPTVSKPVTLPTEITPASDLIDCPTDLAWSPDQRHIAVIGYRTDCPFPAAAYGQSGLNASSLLYQGLRQHTDAGYVAIYDTFKGTRLAAFSPDSAILSSFHQHGLITPTFTAWLATAASAPDQFLAINYTHVLWSADHQRLIIVFTCYIPNNSPQRTATGSVLPGHIVQGLELTDLNGAHAQVALHVSGALTAGTVIWDLTTMQVVTGLPASAPFALQPAALSYSWGSDGTLVPHAPLSSSATLPTATPPNTVTVGAPLGGSASFSIWQPGIVGAAISPQQPGEQDLHGAFTFATNTAAFSPNGRYLATSLGIAGVLVSAPHDGTTQPISTASSAALAQYGWQAAPRLPVRDAGLRAAIRLAEQSGFTSYFALTSYVNVAWRPDGRQIAVSADNTGDVVTVFDCASGKGLATLTPPVVQASVANARTNLIEWSPNGHRLAFYDDIRGTITIWGLDSSPVA